MTATLRAEGVSKSFGGLQALADCSLTAPAGRITGLIGPNGSGKTTLFNAITGYERIDAGQVWGDGLGVFSSIALAAYLTFGHRYLNPRTASVRGKSAAAATDSTGSGVRLFILAVFALLLLVYSIGSFQLWGTMSLFLERSVNRHVNAFEIPTQWFTSIESAALILAAPVFAALWGALARRHLEPDNLIKYALALFLGAAGLLLFAIAAWPHAGATRAGWFLPALGIWI